MGGRRRLDHGYPDGLYEVKVPKGQRFSGDWYFGVAVRAGRVEKASPTMRWCVGKTALYMAHWCRLKAADFRCVATTEQLHDLAERVKLELKLSRMAPDELEAFRQDVALLPPSECPGSDPGANEG
jgi:hypothetical protein